MHSNNVIDEVMCDLYVCIVIVGQISPAPNDLSFLLQLECSSIVQWQRKFRMHVKYLISQTNQAEERKTKNNLSD